MKERRLARLRKVLCVVSLERDEGEKGEDAKSRGITLRQSEGEI